MQARNGCEWAGTRTSPRWVCALSLAVWLGCSEGETPAGSARSGASIPATPQATPSAQAQDVLPMDSVAAGTFAPPPPIAPPTVAPAPEVCSDAEIMPVIEGGGNLLVIFDRSSSMMLPFAGLQTRLDAVHAAINAAITPFLCQVTGPDEPPCTELLHVGAILFPTVMPLGGGLPGLGMLPGLGGLPPLPGLGGCNVDPITADTQIDWQLATPFVETWNAYWQGPNGQLAAGTPIPGAFEQAEAALNAELPPGPTAVLFLTDGESNCVGGVNPIAQAQAWLQRGIPTYVVSVAIGNDAFNNAVAQAGGTDQALNPTDTQQLTNTLQEIIDATVEPINCLIDLNGKEIINEQLACEKGEVLVIPNKLACDPNNGFQIRGPTTIELVGDACAQLQSGRSRLVAKFPCDVLLQ